MFFQINLKKKIQEGMFVELYTHTQRLTQHKNEKALCTKL